MHLSELRKRIFGIKSKQEFERLALHIFRLQAVTVPCYREYCAHIGVNVTKVTHVLDIPYLPIQFFKTHSIYNPKETPELVFSSSRTTGQIPSLHKVVDSRFYEKSIFKGFNHFYGSVDGYCVLALLPSYLEREGSSLVHMAGQFINASRFKESGFYLKDYDRLVVTLSDLERRRIPTLLLGVSFALLELAQNYPIKLNHTLVMETGGMKGRRKEMIREELHDVLKNAFKVEKIHSEYGMTEMLSQAYAQNPNQYHTPPWMKIYIRDSEDPLSLVSEGKTGGINVVDLANLHSCSFIATQDLGKVNADGSIQILGRFDHAEVRGCNLMGL